MFGLIHTAGYFAVALLLVNDVLLCNDVHSQVLRRRSSDATQCQKIQFHVSAKRNDGAPLTSLRAQDLNVAFPYGAAEIVSVTNAAQEIGPGGNTNLLFVIPPFSGVGDGEIEPLLKPLAQTDSFRFSAVVLGPDGVSAQAVDLVTLKKYLQRAISLKTHLWSSPSLWLAAEQKAFLRLRRERGRHVIVRLMLSRNPSHNRNKDVFINDTSMDTYAATDLAEVYHLLVPMSLGETIPMGDAAAEHIDAGPDTLGIEQTSQLQAAIQHQATLWTERAFWNIHTAGGAEDSAEMLIKDVIRNLSSSYEVIVQPRFPCSGAGFRAVDVRTELRDVRLFAPSAIQLIPIDQLKK
jgi:hypothetical protein